MIFKASNRQRRKFRYVYVDYDSRVYPEFNYLEKEAAHAGFLEWINATGLIVGEDFIWEISNYTITHATLGWDTRIFKMSSVCSYLRFVKQENLVLFKLRFGV